MGVELGYEARYGNALTLHYSFNDLFDLHAGLGYNLSGPKIGGGADFLLGLGQSIGLLFGGAFVVSAGRKGEATLDANFTDENSQTTVIKAT